MFASSSISGERITGSASRSVSASRSACERPRFMELAEGVSSVDVVSLKQLQELTGTVVAEERLASVTDALADAAKRIVGVGHRRSD